MLIGSIFISCYKTYTGYIDFWKAARFTQLDRYMSYTNKPPALKLNAVNLVLKLKLHPPVHKCSTHSFHLLYKTRVTEIGEVESILSFNI